jgi:hypothetical protein
MYSARRLSSVIASTTSRARITCSERDDATRIGLRVRARHARQDLELFLALGIGDVHLERETVELRSGSGYVPSCSERILRREHEERLRQRIL